MTAAPSISVVIPTYRRRAGLRRVVEPLLADGAVTEVVVVVDGCRDGSYELLAEIAESDGRLKPHFIENRGRDRARQYGVEQAKGDVTLILDDDVVPGPGLAAGHARHHAGASGLVVVGYMATRVPAGRSPGRFATYLYAHEYEGMAADYEAHPERILAHLWMGNVSLRRDDCLRVGLVAEARDGAGSRGSGRDLAFPPGHEDQDFGLRCSAAGLTAVFDRDLRGVHWHERGLDEFLRDSRDQGASKWLVHRLHADVVGALPADAYALGLPVPGRWVVRICRWELVRRCVVVLGKATIRAAGRLHVSGLEVWVAKIVRRVEHQRGAREFERRWKRAIAQAGQSSTRRNSSG